MFDTRLLWPMVTIGLTLPLSAPVSAQDATDIAVLRDAFEVAAIETDLGSGVQSLISLTSNPGVSAATYNIDDGDEFRILKLAPSHTFDPVTPGGIAPYVEGTLGYLDSDFSEDVSLDPTRPTRADFELDTLSFLAGAGVAIPLSDTLTLRPIAHLGYSSIAIDTDVSGTDAALVATAGDGIIFDLEVDSLLYGPALELGYERKLEGDLNVDADIRYTHLFTQVLDASDPVLEQDSDFGALSAGIEIDGPLPTTVFGRDLRWIGFARGNWLPGDQEDDLGFSTFGELGGGLKLVDSSIVSGIDGISLRGSAILGDDVTGWSIGLQIEL